ncbi:GntR family transcriptional regulator [Erysipelothrix larvae]|uniref:GntR family transcriptional regulator n=1 Tax=Erysipelothrix larvae TaxID=1514105 RepID=A0A120JU07_9FIRM|nr:GntR family transcriptional regulator [Erysipelothrix larvae]AMC94548.1 GntR family transcriptional regulator [Erysipelothrix larvae]
MFSIDLRSNVPIFEQLYQEIGKYIALSILKPDEQLPTVRSLAKELGINPNTVSKAYQEAERSGLIYSVSGVGMFVSNTSEGVKAVLAKAYATLFEAYNALIELGEAPDDIINTLRGLKS